MDFNKDDELDYEEDDFENDFESKNGAEDKTNENSSISESSDQYLQIICPEEEEDFIERIAADSETTKIQNEKKTVEESNKAELKKPPPVEKEQCTQTSNSNESNNYYNNNKNDWKKNNNNNNSGSNSGRNSNSCCNSNDNSNINSKISNKKFKKKRPFQHRLGMKKPPANTITVSPWLPNCNFSSANNVMTPPTVPIYNKQILSLCQDLFPNSSLQFPLLGLTATQLKQNLSQLMPISDRRLHHENIKPNVIMRNENSKSCSLSTQNFNSRVRGFAENYQVCEGKNSVKQWDLQNQTGNKNYEGKNNNSFFNGLYNSLKDEEKELVKLKKEARLKRFMNYDIVGKERKLICSTENETKDGLNLGTEYFQKLEQQKLAREKLMSLKGQQKKSSDFETDKDDSAKKPDINKELLLKKRNPFDANLGKLNCSLTSTIKEEKERQKEVKQESFDRELFTPLNQNFWNKEEEKLLTALDSSSKGLSVAKNEMCSPVQFVRTISKSFDELAVRKPKIKVLENKEDESSSPNPVTTLPFVAANKMSYSGTDLSTQMESQLTGCIVKVFNIPPSSTINDILALCSPIGVVKEIKLNLPKENSVVIRFGEPACAENFFSVYHGQKMNNYFLNVIVI